MYLEQMPYIEIITLLLLIQYTYFGFQVGKARGAANIKAPAMTGDDYYERCVRVHMNTLEQLVIVIPAMWICASGFHKDVAAILGVVFLVSRFMYSASYRKDPASRSTGFMIGFLASTAMILCGLFNAVVHLI